MGLQPMHFRPGRMKKMGRRKRYKESGAKTALVVRVHVFNVFRINLFTCCYISDVDWALTLSCQPT